MNLKSKIKSDIHGTTYGTIVLVVSVCTQRKDPDGRERWTVESSWSKSLNCRCC